MLRRRARQDTVLVAISSSRKLSPRSLPGRSSQSLGFTSVSASSLACRQVPLAIVGQPRPLRAAWPGLRVPGPCAQCLQCSWRQ